MQIGQQVWGKIRERAAMIFVTLLVIAVAVTAGLMLSRHLIRLLADAGATRDSYRATVEGLAERAHHAALADRDRARDSAEVAEAYVALSRQAAETQEALALERKLRKAIRSTVPPLPISKRVDEKNSPGPTASP